MSTPGGSWQQIQSAQPPPAPAVTASVTAAPVNPTPQTQNGGTPTWQQLSSGTSQNNNPNQVMPATVDPRDAAYYDHMARMNYSYSTKLNGLTRAGTQDQAAYTAGSNALTTQLPMTLANTRNQANSQGLLESGILAQRQGTNTAAYATRMGSLAARLAQQNQAISDARQNAVAAFGLGSSSELTNTIGRATARDVANGVNMSAIPIAPTTANQYRPPTLDPGAANIKAQAARNASRGIPPSHHAPTAPASSAGRNASKGVKSNAARIF